MAGHNNGVSHVDLLAGNLRNKRRFFEGFDHEIIAYVDLHEPLPDGILTELRDLSDCLVLRKHFTTYRDVDNCGYSNDIRYLLSLSQATGDIVAHFDMDTCCFARDKAVVEKWLSHLNTHAFVSYPSAWSPRAVDDPSFGPHTWCSTRAFACKRETLRFDELEHALRDPDWAYAKYGEPLRRLGWMEHMLARLNNDSVIYPLRDDDALLMWCWRSYVLGVMDKLNARSFDDVLAYVKMCGSITYPCDISALNP